jgi:hypothetical protein
MLKSLGCALLLGAASLFSAPANAVPVHYDLTFTPSWGGGAGGTGVLTLDLPGIPTNVGLDGSSAQFVSLTATVEGFTFDFPDAKVWWLGMSNGVWNNISAESSPTPSGAASFILGAGGLGYWINQVNGPSLGGGTIGIGAAYLDPPEAGEPVATPLPGALPLFATGLGALTLLAQRRRRKINAGAI